jgi:hypothetical protein
MGLRELNSLQMVNNAFLAQNKAKRSVLEETMLAAAPGIREAAMNSPGAGAVSPRTNRSQTRTHTYTPPDISTHTHVHTHTHTRVSRQ